MVLNVILIGIRYWFVYYKQKMLCSFIYFTRKCQSSFIYDIILTILI